MIESQDPLVSIVTPTFNRAKVLPRAIESVLKQTYINFEHIIVDDGSTDNTESIVENYESDKIRYISLEENQGANAARNRGIEEADGKFISFLDSDDEYLPTRIEKTVDSLQHQADDCGGVCHSHRIIQKNSISTINHIEEKIIRLNELKNGNIIGGFSVTMFRKAVFDQVGYLDEDMPSSQDYEFYLRVLNEYNMLGIDEILVNYYISPNSISFDIVKRQKAERQLLEKHGDTLSIKRKANHHYGRAILQARNDKMTDARKELLIALQLYPWRPIYLYHYIAALFGKTAFQASEKFKLYIKNSLIE